MAVVPGVGGKLQSNKLLSIGNLDKYQISTVDYVLQAGLRRLISYSTHATDQFCMLLTSFLMWISWTLVQARWNTFSTT